MMIDLQGRSLLTLLDFSSSEIEYLLTLATQLKIKKQQRKIGNLLAGKNSVLIFNKPSTRTRCAFETAIFDEGGQVSYLTNFHLGHKESLEDTAKVLGKYYDGIGFRGYSHKEVEKLALYSGIPVWNALTDQYHPTQILADLMTIKEHIEKPWRQIKCVYVGDGRNNIAHSLMIGAAKTGMTLINLAPTSLWPPRDFLNRVTDIANNSGAQIECQNNIALAVKNADVIYTDVWVSMGEESEWSYRIDLLNPYQVNQSMLAKTANNKIIFMHCLPAFHDTETEVGKSIQRKFGLTSLEVSDEVFRGPHSRVFEQAENRLHTIKAVIVATLLEASHVNV